MKSSLVGDFRRLLNKLSVPVQIKAQKTYELWQKEPFHPSLQFKKVNLKPLVYSVRIGMGCRALGRMKDNHVYWYWIGSHAEYDNFLKRL